MNTSIGVYDDHVAALDIGIPAIDLIDIRFGPERSQLSEAIGIRMKTLLTK